MAENEPDIYYVLLWCDVDFWHHKSFIFRKKEKAIEVAEEIAQKYDSEEIAEIPLEDNIIYAIEHSGHGDYIGVRKCKVDEFNLPEY